MYLQGLVAGAIRVDLDGNPAGEVSAADAEHAAATLAEILASRETRRAAAMEAKRAARDHERATSNGIADAFGRSANGKGLDVEGKTRAAPAGVQATAKARVSASGARGEAFFARELAARAGVCHSLAKRAVRLAELDGLITVQRRPRSGRKHLTNIIRIIRAEWLDWLRKGRRKAYATNACNRAKPIFAAS